MMESRPKSLDIKDFARSHENYLLELIIFIDGNQLVKIKLHIIQRKLKCFP